MRQSIGGNDRRHPTPDAIRITRPAGNLHSVCLARLLCVGVWQKGEARTVRETGEAARETQAKSGGEKGSGAGCEGG